MDLQLIPLDVEKIILNYKYQLEITSKFNKCIEEINNIIVTYKSLTDCRQTIRTYKNYETYYFVNNTRFEAEKSVINSGRYYKYWLLLNGKFHELDINNSNN